MRHETHDRRHPLTHHRAPAAHHPDTRGNYISTLLRLLALLLAATLTAQAQWDIEESHTTASLRGIHNVGGGVAWASGTHGTVLRTEDGGYLWQTCTIPPDAKDLDFRGVQAFDENTAIVMSSGPGDQSRLYKTTDGCQTWKLLFTNPDKQGFWDAYRLDQRGHLGILIGDPIVDRFAVWQIDPYDSASQIKRFHHPPRARKGEAAFAASNSAVFVDDVFFDFWIATGGKSGARVIKRINHDFDSFGFDTFPSIAVPVGNDTESSGIFSLSFRNGHNTSNPEKRFLVGLSVGGDYLKPNDSARTAAFTLDGGQRWTAAQTPPHGYRSSVSYDPTQKLWITVGPNGTDISRDDGKNWQPLKPSGYDPVDADKNWNALSLPFVVGPNGRIGKLRTITPTPSPTKTMSHQPQSSPTTESARDTSLTAVAVPVPLSYSFHSYQFRSYRFHSQAKTRAHSPNSTQTQYPSRSHSSASPQNSKHFPPHSPATPHSPQPEPRQTSSPAPSSAQSADRKETPKSDRSSAHSTPASSPPAPATLPQQTAHLLRQADSPTDWNPYPPIPYSPPSLQYLYPSLPHPNSLPPLPLPNSSAIPSHLTPTNQLQTHSPKTSQTRSHYWTNSQRHSPPTTPTLATKTIQTHSHCWTNSQRHSTPTTLIPATKTIQTHSLKIPQTHSPRKPHTLNPKPNQTPPPPLQSLPPTPAPQPTPTPVPPRSAACQKIPSPSSWPHSA